MPCSETLPIPVPWALLPTSWPISLTKWVLFHVHSTEQEKSGSKLLAGSAGSVFVDPTDGVPDPLSESDIIVLSHLDDL